MEQYTKEKYWMFLQREKAGKRQRKGRLLREKADFLLYHSNFEHVKTLSTVKKMIKRIIQTHNLKINSVKRKFSAPLISTPTLTLCFLRSVYFPTLSAASSHTGSHISKKDVLVAPSRSICVRACQLISSYGI